MKIYITAIIHSKSELRGEVEEVLTNMVSQTRKEIACEAYTLHQGIKDKNQFVFYEIWRDQAGLDLHNQQSYIQDFIQLVDHKLAQKPIILLTELKEI